MRTGMLSGGWKQRLSLGCAILHDPPVIFLDEPTSGVDPISRRRFWDLIYEMAGRGTTIFVTTHYMDEAEYCDRIAMIYRGALIAMGSPAALKEETVREDVLDVKCSRPSDALALIERLDTVKEAALFGSGLHVSAHAGERAAREIREMLTAKGYEVWEISAISPTMEDVFVSLIEEHDRRDGAQSEVAA